MSSLVGDAEASHTVNGTHREAGLSSFVRSDDECESERRSNFPMYTLPEVTRRYVDEGAAAVGVPEDFIAVPLLAAVGAALGQSVQIRLKDGFEMHGALWAVVVGAPGTAKSPALNFALEPLKWLHELRQDDELYTSDATFEALTGLLAKSAGLVCIYDELARFVKSFDRYRGNGGDRQHWLSTWSQTTLKVDRVGAGSTTIERPVVSIVGSIQPDVLPELLNEADTGDGFIDRFLWAFPEATLQKWNEQVVGERTKEAFRETLQQLAERRSRSEPVTVELSPGARERWVAWYDVNQAIVERESGSYQGMCSKFPVHVARLALILHCLTRPAELESARISEQTMSDAIDLGEYFRGQAHRVLRHIDPSGSTRFSPDARRLLEMLRQSPAAELARTELHNATGRHWKAARLDGAISELSGQALVEVVRDESTGGRPAEVVRLLPHTEGAK